MGTCRKQDQELTTSTAAADANKKPERNNASNPTARKKNSGRQTGMQNSRGYAGRNTGAGQKRSEKAGGACTRGQTHKPQASQGGWPGRPPTDKRNTMAQEGSRWLKVAQAARCSRCGCKGPVWMPVLVVAVVADVAVDVKEVNVDGGVVVVLAVMVMMMVLMAAVVMVVVVVVVWWWWW